MIYINLKTGLEVSGLTEAAEQGCTHVLIAHDDTAPPLEQVVAICGSYYFTWKHYRENAMEHKMFEPKTIRIYNNSNS